jgi:hypothetical protein
MPHKIKMILKGYFEKISIRFTLNVKKQLEKWMTIVDKSKQQITLKESKGTAISEAGIRVRA